MRILHTADWHLGKNLEGQSRMNEQEQFLNDLVLFVEEQKIDLILIAGDVYDSSNPPARAEKMFYDTLKKLSKDGDRITVIIAGNHDNPDRLVAAGPLAREHGIIMAGTPKTIIPTGDYGKNQVTESGEGYVKLRIGNEKAVIITTPYPSEKRLNEVLYGEMDSDKERVESYEARLKQLFDELKIQFEQDTVNLIISHLFVFGSEESGSERSIQLGGSYLVKSSIFPKEAQYIALGHVHKPQVVPGSDKRARYSGSPLHYSSSEISFEKKLLVVDVTPNTEIQVSEFPIKVYKPIEIWRCAGVGEAIKRCEENQDKDSFVYLEIETDRFIREDEIKEMKSLKDDILSIRPITKEEKEREEEGRGYQERPFEELFKEFYLKERGVEVEEETLHVLMSIVNKEEE